MRQSESKIVGIARIRYRHITPGCAAFDVPKQHHGALNCFENCASPGSVCPIKFQYRSNRNFHVVAYLNDIYPGGRDLPNRWGAPMHKVTLYHESVSSPPPPNFPKFILPLLKRGIHQYRQNPPSLQKYHDQIDPLSIHEFFRLCDISTMQLEPWVLTHSVNTLSENPDSQTVLASENLEPCFQMWKENCTNSYKGSFISTFKMSLLVESERTAFIWYN